MAVAMGCGMGTIEDGQDEGVVDTSLESEDDAGDVVGRDAGDGGKSAPKSGVSDAGRTGSTSRADAAVATAGDGGTASGSGTSTTPSGNQKALTSVLHAEGGDLLDTCGERFAARGVEQLTAKAFSNDSTLAGIVREVALTGSNAVRILPTEEVTAQDLDAMLAAFAAEHIVVYISPGKPTWFARDDMKPVLLRHQKGLILDAYQEPNHSDEARWVTEAKAAIATVRDAGFSCPVTVLAPGYGRQLPMALARGSEIAKSDPMHNTVIGWQAYWGQSGWYQGEAKMSLTEGVAACAAQDFPMQVGIDLYADPGDAMDYSEVMAATETHGVGWLWWNWWNQWDDMGNNLSRDGSYAHLTDVGDKVIRSDAHSIQKTAKKACFR